jgi:hypothetical protein
MLNIPLFNRARKPVQTKPALVAHIHEMTVDQAIDAFLTVLDEQSYIDFDAAQSACDGARQHAINNPSKIWTIYNRAVFAGMVD